MAVVEILGDRMHKVFRECGINYTKTYSKRCNPKKEHDAHYEVYEISPSDLKKLEEVCEMPYGSWWRYAKGCNLGTPFDFFTVNSKELIAWGGPSRDDLMDDWNNEPDEEKAAYHYSFREYEKAMSSYKYDTLTEYMCYELGISMEGNVCALAVDLARANGLTMSKLFELYEG